MSLSPPARQSTSIDVFKIHLFSFLLSHARQEQQIQHFGADCIAPDIMAAAGVLRQPAMQPSMPTTFKPIIKNGATKRKLAGIDFDPKQHLAYQPPESIIMMKDIGYAEDTGVSPVAVSQPFQLFTPEAIQKFRDEVLSPDVMKNCFYKSSLAACQLRGYAPK